MLALLLAVAAASTPSVGCDRRAEPSPATIDPAKFVVAGPVAWGARHRAVGRRAESVFKKAGIVVDAGSPVTLRVITPRAALVYRMKTRLAERWQDADRVLRVKPCPPDEPSFSSEGTVGPRTGFAGMLIADRRKCIRVRVTRDGESWTARLPLGRRCR